MAMIAFILGLGAMFVADYKYMNSSCQNSFDTWAMFIGTNSELAVFKPPLGGRFGEGF